MMEKLTKKVDSFLVNETAGLSPLFSKLKELAFYRGRIMPLLVDYKNKIDLANIINNKAIFIVASGAVATQIRFQHNQIVAMFKKDPLLQHINDIQCKVRPETTQSRFSPINRETSEMQPLSQTTAKMMTEIVNEIQDCKLKEVMQRIASHVKSEDSV